MGGVAPGTASPLPRPREEKPSLGKAARPRKTVQIPGPKQRTDEQHCLLTSKMREAKERKAKHAARNKLATAARVWRARKQPLRKVGSPQTPPPGGPREDKTPPFLGLGVPPENNFRDTQNKGGGHYGKLPGARVDPPPGAFGVSLKYFPRVGGWAY